jgi:hypothetical protein
LAQAKLFAEVARRTERPFDALPTGNVSVVLLRLWQEAARSALAAAAEAAPLDAGPSLSESPAAARAAGGASMLATIEQLLNQPGPPERVDMAPQVQLMATFAKRLIDDLERPSRQRWISRWLPVVYRVTAVLVAVVALAAGGYLLLRPNLARRATRTQSSSIGDCSQGECGLAELHTLKEHHPWVKYDFGSPRALHSLSLQNRLDCCYERTVPLIVEVSDDDSHWQEIVRTERPFVTWSAPLHGSARYVRLRLDTTNYLHLREVVIR